MYTIGGLNRQLIDEWDSQTYFKPPSLEWDPDYLTKSFINCHEIYLNPAIFLTFNPSITLNVKKCNIF